MGMLVMIRGSSVRIDAKLQEVHCSYIYKCSYIRMKNSSTVKLFKQYD